VTTTTANVEQFHSRLRRSLLRLEEHRILRLALGASLIRAGKGWIRSNILRDTGRLAYGVVEHVAENAGGGCFFGVLAGSAGELEAVGVGVFFGVQHVRTFAAESEGDLLHVFLLLFAGTGCWGGHGWVC